MTLPLGVQSSQPNMVCKLNKSLYGLKQASRQWFAKLSTFLISLGYKQSHHDHSLFTKIHNSKFTALLIYVDDLILAGNDNNEIISVKNHLDAQFKIKDLGTLKYFLGLEVARNHKGITLCQRKYALDLLFDTGFLHSKPVPTPMVKHINLHDQDSTLFHDPLLYRQLVGRLLYITNTRPDLSFATQQLSQFMTNPTTRHHQALTRVLRYIKNSLGQGLLYPTTSTIQIKGFTDSDRASCPTTRRSISGFCMFFGDSLVSWKSKKHPTVSRSSSEAEYRALTIASCKVPYKEPAILYCDNDSARYIAANVVFHERTKHIEIGCHIAREHLQNKLYHLLPIHTHEQTADILTKALEPSSFYYLLPMLGVYASAG
ncbi:PREDICTED: uncharacterized protein LOC109325899 [Lupinus angustifolius]|uniref:uncharacterized protein LOC109325899 n=1 Tax=Lupinus angustifolius TaxID=3871 RepID=UPI00092E9765|nr:PREDICTED: uncharacterized protein LOC109325899 [Lupinus angustifolius]